MAKDLVGIDETGFEHRVFLDTDASLAADSDEKVASQKAVKQYVADNAGGAVPVKATGAELDTGTDDAKFATAKAIRDSLIGVQPKVYIALLSQAGTDPVVATVFKNTLGAPIVWSRSDMGHNEGTLTGAFPVGKVICYPSNAVIYDDNDQQGVVLFSRVNDNQVDLQTLDTGALAKDLAVTSVRELAIKIEVYP